ncbi:hypothetical protein D3C87_2090070 [compost metagenome]
MRRVSPVLSHLVPYRLEPGFGIDHEHGHVDDIVERAARLRQNGVQVGERKARLCLQVGLGRAVLAAADLARNE